MNNTDIILLPEGLSITEYRGVLKGLKQFIDEELAKGLKPLQAIRVYEEKLAKYKHKFKDQNDKEIETLAKEFNGEVVKA